MITIWHNPRCSKSRETLAIVQEAGPVTIRLYLENAPSAEEIQGVLAQLGRTAIEMMRPKEAEFKAMGLSKTDSDEQLIAAMVETPKLIERPIVITKNGARIGRPPETVREVL